MSSVKIIAHRGASAYAGENSIEAFEQAIERNAWAIECDVRRCASGELVLIHDPEINRITGKPGVVSQLPLAELQTIHLKTGEWIPSLREALESMHGQLSVILDVKEEGVAEELALIINDMIASGDWRSEQFFATGFEHRELQKLHQLIPAIRIAPAFAGTPHNLGQAAQDLNAYAVCFLDFIFSPALFADIQKRGMKAWVYVSHESPENITNFVEMGADAIMVNAPDRAAQIIAQFRTR